jgi:membrane protein
MQSGNWAIMNTGFALAILKETYSKWRKDNAMYQSAALAYYTAVSIIPLMIIVIAISGLVFGHEAARDQIVSQIRGLIGPKGADAINTMIEDASHSSGGIIATAIGMVILILGSTGVFIQLHYALNLIWCIEPRHGRGVWGLVEDRFFSFLLVLVTGFLLLVSLVTSAGFAALESSLGGAIPRYVYLLHILNFAVSFAFTALLFAMIFKMVPDARIDWGDVWIGAVATSLLFSIGRLIISLFIGFRSLGSFYGAIGSLVVILLWIYYSTNILLLGAEFTQVYSSRHSRIEQNEMKA